MAATYRLRVTVRNPNGRLADHMTGWFLDRDGGQAARVKVAAIVQCGYEMPAVSGVTVFFPPHRIMLVELVEGHD